MEGDFGNEGTILVQEAVTAGKAITSAEDDDENYFSFKRYMKGEKEIFEIIDEDEATFEDEEYDDELCEYLGSNTNNRKKKRKRTNYNREDKIGRTVERASYQKRRAKKSQQHRVDGVQLFYSDMLSWNLRKIFCSCLQLPLTRMPSHFAFASQYYRQCRELVMEETAHCIQSGLKSISSSGTLTLKFKDEITNLDEIMLIYFDVTHGSSELLKPGTCFVMYPQQCRFKRFDFSLSSKFTGFLGCIYPQRVVAGSRIATICIHQSFKDVMYETGMLSAGCTWVAHEVGNVITHQRMAATCSKAPVPFFMSKLLGGRQSSHIKFDSDDSSSEASTCDELSGTTTVLSAGAVVKLPSLDSGEIVQPKSMLSDIFVVDKSIGHVSSSRASVHSGPFNQIIHPPDIRHDGGAIDRPEGAQMLDSSDASSDSDGSDSDNEATKKAKLMSALRLTPSPTLTNAVTNLPQKDSNTTLASDESSIICRSTNLDGRDESYAYSSSLNTSQRNAMVDIIRDTCEIESLAHGSCSLVQGPPGCGKSHFLSALLGELVLSRNKRVLACAPSNKAVCVLLEKFLRLHRELGGGKEVSIVLTGVEEKLDSATDRNIRKDVNFKKNSSWQGSRPNDVVINSFGLPKLKDERVYLNEGLSSETIDAVTIVLNPSKASDLFAYKLSEKIGFALKALSDDVSALSKVIAKEGPKHLKSFSFQVQEFLKKVKEYTNNINNRIAALVPYRIREEIEEYYESVMRKLSAVGPINSLCDVSFVSSYCGRLAELGSSLLQFSIFINSSEMSVDIAGYAVANADILFCTLASSGQGIVNRFQNIEIMVVDEAAQALEPELCIAFSLTPRHLVLVGDPFQLSATLLSPRAQSLKRGDSTMKRLMASSSRPFHLLSTQYRMHPQISQLPNKLFYDSRIADSEHVILRQSLFDSTSFDSPVPWLQNFSFIHVDGDEYCGDGRSRLSISNKREALFISGFVNYLSRTFSHIDVSKQVCIITFYAGQVDVISRQLDDIARSFSDKKMIERLRGTRVVTVDSFQGSEADIVILSFVRSNINNRVGFLNDFSRINVAMTRAKHLLLCIGDSNTLENCGLDYLKTIITDAKSRSKFFDGDALARAHF